MLTLRWNNPQGTGLVRFLFFLVPLASIIITKSNLATRALPDHVRLPLERFHHTRRFEADALSVDEMPPQSHAADLFSAVRSCTGSGYSSRIGKELCIDCDDGGCEGGSRHTKAWWLCCAVVRIHTCRSLLLALVKVTSNAELVP